MDFGNFSSFQARKLDPDVQHTLGWNLEPEDLILIPEHWLTFPEPHKSVHLLLGMLYLFYFIASMIGNGLVLYIFSTSKSLRSASNMFVVNLAICDLIMTVKAPLFLYNSINFGFATGHLGCQILAGGGSISGIGAGMTNAAIAYDRFMAITRPFDGKVTKVKALIIIILIWFYNIPWLVLPLLEIWGRYSPEGFLTTCSFDYLTRTFDNRLFVASIFTFSYVFPMSMIIYFYSQIVSKVFSHEKALREQAKKMNVDSLRANQQQNVESAEIRIAKAAITICFLYVVAWTPYAVLALIGAFGDQSLITPGVSMIPALYCKTVACVDPYVYAISHPKFRLELQKKLPWLAITEKEGGGNAESTATTPSAAVVSNA